MIDSTFTCVLCNGTFSDDESNNPAPLADEGSCCGNCNSKKVLPARLEEMGEPPFLGDELDEAAMYGEQDAESWASIAKRSDLMHMHEAFYNRYSSHLGTEGDEWLISIGSEPKSAAECGVATGTEFYRWLRENYPITEPSVHPSNGCGRDVVLEAWAIAFEKAAARLWHMHADEPDFGK